MFSQRGKYEKDIFETLVKKKRVTNLDLVYMYDVFHTTEKLFQILETGKEIFDKNLVEGFNQAVDENIFKELELKLKEIVAKSKKGDKNAGNSTTK